MERAEVKKMKEQVLAVQRMQDYIEQNLSQDIHLSGLARAAMFSPWYSYRLFREYLELTPQERHAYLPEKLRICYIVDAMTGEIV